MWLGQGGENEVGDGGAQALLGASGTYGGKNGENKMLARW